MINELLHGLPEGLSVLIVIYLIVVKVVDYLRLEKKKESGDWVELKDIMNGVKASSQAIENMSKVMEKMSVLEEKQNDWMGKVYYQQETNNKALERIEHHLTFPKT